MTQPTPRPRNRRRPPGPPPPPPAADIYASAAEFFEEALSIWYARDYDANSFYRCPEYWRHPEATARISALHKSWEECNRDGGRAPASWWVNYADPIMRELLGPEGTFRGCSIDKGHHPKGVPFIDD